MAEPTEHAINRRTALFGNDNPQSGDITHNTSSTLAEENTQIDRDAKQALSEKIERLSSLDLLASNEYVINRLSEQINARIHELFGVDIELAVEQPSIKGKKAASTTDLVINIIPLARSIENAPSVPELSARIAEAISDISYIKKVDTVGPFVNIEVAGATVGNDIFDQVAVQGEHYGWSRDRDPEIIVIDYSSPNVAKNLTLAHLRSTIIGQSVANLKEATGDVPFGINHIGDWGTHFGNIIYQYKRELAERGEEFLAELEDNPAKVLMAIYRKFNENVKTLPEEVAAGMLAEGRQVFLELEQGDPEYVALWRKFRNWSLDDFAPTYERLNDVRFDAIQGESFYEDRMGDAVQEALQAEVLLQLEDGSVVFPSQVLIDPATMKENTQIMRSQSGDPRNEIVVKPTGGTVYLTRDLAAILYRVRELGASKVLYVIGKEQGSHCIELFNIAHQMGAVALGDAQHVSFGHLNISGQKMSSRSGKITLLNEVLDEARDAAATILGKRHSDEPVPIETAEEIGVSATIFNDLRQDRTKDIEFDPENDVPSMLKNGGAVYIQYTYARLNSILRKAAETNISPAETESTSSRPSTNTRKSEKDILVQISMFPRVIRDAADYNAPHRVATYLTELCQSVNSFLSEPESRVLDAKSPDERDFRLKLVASTSQVVQNAVLILQMRLPEHM